MRTSTTSSHSPKIRQPSLTGGANDTGYYYFAYGKDGVSHFFRTYDEHLAFVNSDMYAPD